MSVALITATVKYAAKPCTTQYGDRINAVITLPNGEEVKLWGKPEDRSIADLKRGQSVQLIQDAKGYKILEAAAPTPVPAAPAINSEQAYEEVLRRTAWRYGRAIRAAKFIAENELGLSEEQVTQSPELVKEIAASLFIEANKQIR